jgi:uncharacterized protein YndB with AHSA1/START domain
MTVKRDATTGARTVELELEVPGTPEQVWHAIATGPGITAWFVPTEVDEREGGAITFDFGPEIGGSAVVTAWEPPRRFAYEEREWMPGAPPVATEIHVEARGGGRCVMRMVHSLFTSSDEWDDQLEGFENGWPPFLHVLKGYLAGRTRPCGRGAWMAEGHLEAPRRLIAFTRPASPSCSYSAGPFSPTSVSR